MFSKNNTSSKIDREQHELLENAHRRVSQKKKLYYHFVVFLIGSVFMIVINKVLDYGVQYDWFVWGILLWSFLFLMHAFNVYVTHAFMGKDWERTQREKLVARQKEKIARLQKEVEREYPLPDSKKNITNE